MTYLEFVRTTQAMRSLQKQYFRERSSDILERCKEAERDVDRAVKAYFQKPTPLFAEEPDE